VGDVPVEELRRDARHVHHLAYEIEHERVLHALALHEELHVRPRRAAHLLDRLLEAASRRNASRALAVDREDLVAALDASAVRRRAVDGRDDREHVAARIDLDAYAREVPLRLALEALPLFGRHVRRVRIELAHHTADRAVHDPRALHRFDIAVLDLHEDATEL